MVSQGAHSMVDRMIGASRLSIHIFEEVEADTSATKQALLVVFLAALATGIGIGGLNGLLVGVPLAVAGWAIWAFIVYFIGTKILPEHETHADWGQLARSLGFAQSPGVLKVFGVLPDGGIIFLVVSVWMLVAMVIAVRQALDYTSTKRAICVVLLGFIPYLILMSYAYSILGLGV